ncbi:MAG TPA: ankyrin repeat domain-containing protein [Burkholderiaceae bacterium]|nr:ankyrin repeat domain-containing protein [Burkholderiaceae bacterium]
MKNFKFAIYLTITACISSAVAGSFEDFFRAIRTDNADTVATLLQRGFDPNAHDEKGQTALGLAVREHAGRVVDVLLKHPQLDVNALNGVGETALMFAALQGELELTSRLIARGASVSQQGWNPLHYAATGPESKVVALLLQRGAPIEARSPNGTTALMMAARYGSEQSVMLLLEQHADATARNDRGMNAADFARSAGRETLAKRLESRLQ